MGKAAICPHQGPGWPSSDRKYTYHKCAKLQAALQGLPQTMAHPLCDACIAARAFEGPISDSPLLSSWYKCAVRGRLSVGPLPRYPTPHRWNVDLMFDSYVAIDPDRQHQEALLREMFIQWSRIPVSAGGITEEEITEIIDRIATRHNLDIEPYRIVHAEIAAITGG